MLILLSAAKKFRYPFVKLIAEYLNQIRQKYRTGRIFWMDKRFYKSIVCFVYSLKETIVVPKLWSVTGSIASFFVESTTGTFLNRD